jgi:hypothetical protein
VLVVAVRSAHADEDASSAARPEYEASHHLLMWEGRKKAEQRGFVVDVTYSLDTYLAPQLKNKVVAGGLLTLEIDVKDRVHLSGFAIHGGGVTNELGDLHGTSGNTAPPDVRLFEAWVDQPIGPVTIRGGLLSADQEYVLADSSQLLLGATFGITSQFSANLLGPVYPIATPGISTRVENKWLGGRIAVYDGELVNKHGIPTKVGPDMLVVGELHLLDTLKLGAWHHTTRGNAVYGVLDKQVQQDVGVFARAGHSPDGPVTTYIDAGTRIRPRGFRNEDLISFGLAFAHAEDGAQTAIELSYEVQVRFLSIQPDVQMIMMRDRTVGVFVTRLTIAL